MTIVPIAAEASSLSAPLDLQQMYRLYNAEGDLLYLGISYSALARIAQHSKSQAWWAAVVRIEVESFTMVSRRTMETAEREAIIREQPLYNKHHAGSHRPASRFDWIARWRADGRVCPSCGKESIYDYHNDRFFHADGTVNRPCWADCLRDNAPFRGDW